MERLDQAWSNIAEGFEIRNPAMKRIYKTVAAYARDGKRILFHGPSGVGKEYLARFYCGEFVRSRKDAVTSPFVAVNCACLGSLASNELFGHVRGAFTDALYDKPGFFEEAKGGVLFLDEVADLPAEVQPLLLRALDKRGTARRVGSVADYATDSVIVLSSTDQDLDTLRRALLFRLGIVVEVPGLDARLDEIEPAIGHYLWDALRSRRDLDSWTWCGTPPVRSGVRENPVLRDLVLRLVPRLTAMAQGIQWPGHFRSLKQAVEFAVCVAEPVSVAGFARDIEARFGRYEGMSGGVPHGGEESRIPVTLPDPGPRERLHSVLRLVFPKTPPETLEGLARFLQERGSRPFRRMDIDRYLGVSPSSSNLYLNALVKEGAVERVQSSLYQAKEARNAGARSASAADSTGEAALSPLDEERLGFLRSVLATKRGVFISSPPAEISRVLDALARAADPPGTVLRWEIQRDGSLRGFLRAVESQLLEKRIVSVPFVAVEDPRGLELLTRYLGDNLEILQKGKRGMLAILILHAREMENEDRIILQMIVQSWTSLSLVVTGLKKPNFLRVSPDIDLMDLSTLGGPRIP